MKAEPVNPISESAKWFNVKNYVSLLCDHLASIVRSVVRGTSIEAFHANNIEIIRTAILGPKHGEGKRPGRRFEENGLLVYDIEVLDVKILDDAVRKLLSDAQRNAIVSDCKRSAHARRLGESTAQQKREAPFCSASTLAFLLAC